MSIPDWTDGIITIRASHSVTINGGVIANQIQIQTNGTLIITDTGGLTLVDDSGEDLVCDGVLWLQQGGINGPGTILINSGGTFKMVGGVYYGAGTLSTTLTNNGLIDWTNDCPGCGGQTFGLNLTNGSIANNNTFNIVCNTIGGNTQVVTNGILINNGNIIHSSPWHSNTMNFNTVTFTNNGSILLKDNTTMNIAPTTGSSNSGSYTNNATGSLIFKGSAAQTYTSGSNFNGTGLIEFNGGTHT